MKVTLAYPHTSDGKTHKADTTVDLPDDEARDLVHYGRARWPQKKTAATASEEK